MNVPENELIELMKMGDTRAFSILYSKYWRSVYCKAFYLLRDEAKAEDVAQEVFYKLLKNSKIIDSSQPILPFLKTATRNRCVDVQRASNARSKFEKVYSAGKDIVIQPAYHLEYKDLQFAISSAVKQASPAVQEFFNLRFNQGWSVDQIAQEKGISARTVRNQLSRAHKYVRSSIEKIWAL